MTRLAKSYGLMERGACTLMTMVPTPPFNVILIIRARNIDDYAGGHYSIPHDDAVIGPEELGRRVRPRQDRACEDPPMIPVEDEIPNEWFNVEGRRYQDDLGRSLNFTNRSFIQMFNHFNIQHVDGGQFPYVPTWEERINTRRSEAGGSGARENDEEEEDED